MKEYGFGHLDAQDIEEFEAFIAANVDAYAQNEAVARIRHLACCAECRDRSGEVTKALLEKRQQELEMLLGTKTTHVPVDATLSEVLVDPRLFDEKQR